MDDKNQEELERQNYKYGYQEQKKTLKGLYRTALAIAAVLGVISIGNFYTGHLNGKANEQHQATVTTLKQQIATLTDENTQLKRQKDQINHELQTEKHAHRVTEDRRYHAQRKLNRTSEKMAELQGNTREAKAMLNQLQTLLK